MIRLKTMVFMLFVHVSFLVAIQAPSQAVSQAPIQACSRVPNQAVTQALTQACRQVLNQVLNHHGSQATIQVVNRADGLQSNQATSLPASRAIEPFSRPTAVQLRQSPQPTPLPKSSRIQCALKSRRFQSCTTALLPQQRHATHLRRGLLKQQTTAGKVTILSRRLTK